MLAGAARAGDGGRDRRAVGGDREGQLASSRRGAARSSASTRGPAGRAGTWSRRNIPEAEIQNLIVELRSATAGVGTFNAKFDHLAELTGKAADQVLAGRGAKAA